MQKMRHSLTKMEKMTIALAKRLRDSVYKDIKFFNNASINTFLFFKSIIFFIFKFTSFNLYYFYIYFTCIYISTSNKNVHYKIKP